MNALTCILAGVLGLLVGHVHFALLRRAVGRWAGGSVRGFWLGRIASVAASVAVLVLVARFAGAGALLAAAAGFLLARILHLRRAAARTQP